jgi:LmbE family N-acetylglucosaminyl deacetylase
MSESNPLSRNYATEAKSLPPLDVPQRVGRLVIVAPHPDDETLGAGGLAYDLSIRGWSVDVVVVTDGSASHPGVAGLAAIRANENKCACTALGLRRRPIQLGFRDGHLSPDDPSLVTALVRVLAGADIVVAPRFDDGHADHAATERATTAAVRTMTTQGPTEQVRAGTQQPPNVWHYAVWGWERLSREGLALGAGSAFRLSPAALTAKARAIASYPSQTTDRYGPVILPPAVLEHFRGNHEVFWC